MVKDRNKQGDRKIKNQWQKSGHCLPELSLWVLKISHICDPD